MCLHQGWFTQFTPLSKHTKVILGNNSTIPTIGIGCIKVQMFAKGKWVKSVLQDILYILNLYGNLLSISHLMHHGTEVHFLSENCHIYNQWKSIILKGKLHNDLYVICMQVSRVGVLITGFYGVVENIILRELGVPLPLSAWFFIALVGEYRVLVGER